MTHSEVELCKLARVAVGGSARQNALGSSRHTSTHSRGISRDCISAGPSAARFHLSLSRSEKSGIGGVGNGGSGVR